VIEPNRASAIARAAADVDWSAYTMPPSTEDYRPEDVPVAFVQLWSSTTQTEAQSAYDAVLESIVHNHSGWLYAAAVPATPLLTRMVLETTGLPRRMAIHLLANLLWWSTPGQEFTDPYGVTIRTREFIRNTIQVTRPTLLELSTGTARKPITVAAFELLEALDETA